MAGAVTTGVNYHPRSIFAPRSIAARLKIEGINIGHYEALKTPGEKTFFILPLGYSEEIERLNITVVDN